MSLSFKNRANLSSEEVKACESYQTDATFLHACTQGWSGQFPGDETFQAFLSRCTRLAANLRSAIDKFEVDEPGVVYSGHGLGISVLGSLVGRPAQFIGLEYSYPGFTSTSEDRSVAEKFLRSRASGGRLPVILEINLKSGQKALPFSRVTSGVGEGEVLLPPGALFKIIDAQIIKIDQVEQKVLHLTLE